MVERELEPYQREGGPRILIKGPDVLLPPQCTSILAMTLHELATNAVKYGALSAPAGQLSVAWKTSRNRLLLTWEERGAGVALKRSNGFGMQSSTRASATISAAIPRSISGRRDSMSS
jgi:two-component sensor histidine kinase